MVAGAIESSDKQRGGSSLPGLKRTSTTMKRFTFGGKRSQDNMTGTGYSKADDSVSKLSEDKNLLICLFLEIVEISLRAPTKGDEQDDFSIE